MGAPIDMEVDMFVAQLGAPVDTATVVAVVKDVISGGIQWLDPRVVDWVANLLLGLPIVPVILTWKGIGTYLRALSPWINEHVGKKLERFAFIINPILAGLIAGTVFGDSTIGLAATAAWSMIESATKQFAKPSAPSESGMAKGRALALIVAASLALGMLASPSRAAVTERGIAGLTLDKGVQPDSKASFLERVAFSAGGGFKREFAPGPNDLVGFLGVQVGYLWNDHLSPRVRVTRDLREGSYWEAEVSVWGVW